MSDVPTPKREALLGDWPGKQALSPLEISPPVIHTGSQIWEEMGVSSELLRAWPVFLLAGLITAARVPESLIQCPLWSWINKMVAGRRNRIKNLGKSIGQTAPNWGPWGAGVGKN